MAKIGRKAELRRIAAKRGWDDGHEGRDQDPPRKAVMKPFANGFGYNPVPQDEEKAYFDAYDAGQLAEPNAVNPFRT